jgi:hypothetical protein
MFHKLFKKNAKQINLSVEENLDHIEELTDNETMAVVGGSLFNGGVAISFDDRGNGADQDFLDFTISAS